MIKRRSFLRIISGTSFSMLLGMKDLFAKSNKPDQSIVLIDLAALIDGQHKRQQTEITIIERGDLINFDMIKKIDRSSFYTLLSPVNYTLLEELLRFDDEYHLKDSSFISRELDSLLITTASARLVHIERRLFL